jgi:uncharacterized protein with von Willebrand factor type A (vWA) domain
MKMTAFPEGSGYLLHNILLFGRLLHGLGLDVNPSRMITLVQALEHIEIGQKNDFYHAARCLLVHDYEDIALFDQAFDLFWRQPEERRLTLTLVHKQRQTHSPAQPGETRPAIRVKTGRTAIEDSESGDELSPQLDATRTYSAQEILRQKDFAELDADELEAINKLMARLVWQLGLRRTRRYRPGRGLTIDMRRSLRRNLGYGGELLEWSFRKPKFKPRPLVIIADISGSMERYTRLLLHFIYSLTKGLEHSVEAFVFGTRLTRISRQLELKDVDLSMKEITRSVPDWSGGTRIGANLKKFNYHWARRILSRGAVVLMISDGWDRGDPHLLANEMARLQRSCHRLIWLNPLLGSPNYQPLTRGMMAALPYIDDFLPVHNLATLEALARHLEWLDDRRPSRRQQIKKYSMAKVMENE